MNQPNTRTGAVIAGLTSLLICTPPVQALMAGMAPDSPAARVDPNTSESPYAGVGSVIVGGSALSGVVIASQYVLTAAHVAAGQSPAAMQFALNLNGTTQWLSAVESATVYPSFNYPYDDLAVLKLATPVPAGVPVYQMYTGPLIAGLTITLVGYGESGNGNVGVTVGGSSGVKRTGTNTVDALLTSLDTGGRMSRFFVYDFDGPSGNGSSGGPTTGNALETLVAVGDSGSPSFVRSGSQLQLLGINTFVSPAPGQTTVNYEFGTLGGGIVAADPRFSSWLAATTNGTLGVSSVDVPLPAWAGGLLAALLAGCMAAGQLRRRHSAADSQQIAATGL